MALLVDELILPLLLNVAQRRRSNVVSLVAETAFTYLVERSGSLSRTSQLYQCLGLVEQHLGIAQFDAVYIVVLDAGVDAGVGAAVHALAIDGQGDRRQIGMDAAVARVGDAGDDAELLARVVVRPVLEGVDGLYVHNLRLLLERIGPCAVVLMVALLVDAVALMVDGEYLLGAPALVGNAEEVLELGLQRVDAQLIQLVGILHNLLQARRVPALGCRVNTRGLDSLDLCQRQRIAGPLQVHTRQQGVGGTLRGVVLGRRRDGQCLGSLGQVLYYLCVDGINRLARCADVGGGQADGHLAPQHDEP